ncbi:MAG: NAD(P)/FAD-dependent oxidoreductase [Syntrophaceae bacterium]
MSAKAYDLAVIGSGPGGHAAAVSSAQLGARVLIVEKNGWGGTCTNCGCVPTKALLACSRSFAELGKLKRLGISATGSFDFSAMKRHQNQIVRTAVLGVRKSLEDSGAEMRQGLARIVSAGQVEITSEKSVERIEARNILIAWGGKPQIPAGWEISGRMLNSDGFLDLQELPASVAIIGGGVIGLEFATFLSQLGAKVSIIEFMDRILPCEEPEASAFLDKELRKSGVDIYCSSRVENIAPGRDSVRLKIFRSDETMEITSAYALICTGRKAALNTEELDLIGIAHNKKAITVDAAMMTNIAGIYAVGDVTGGALLAHRAARQGKALAHRLFGDGSVKYQDIALPYVCYTAPNIARVGLIESEAKSLYPGLERISFEYAANTYARIELKANGFGKLLFGEDRLVGATLAGADAAEMIAPLGLAVANGLGKAEFKKWIIAHPTLSEMINPL